MNSFLNKSRQKKSINVDVITSELSAIRRALSDLSTQNNFYVSSVACIIYETPSTFNSTPHRSSQFAHYFHFSLSFATAAVNKVHSINAFIVMHCAGAHNPHSFDVFFLCFLFAILFMWHQQKRSMAWRKKYVANA
jgi:hypothetical protein